MRTIIINADDFGMCHNYNKWILELASVWYITSTSVITSRISSDQLQDIEELKKINISIGLHIEFFDTNFEFHLDRQYDHFIKIFWKKPSHVDLHSLTYRENARPFIEDLCKKEWIAIRKYYSNEEIKMVTNDRISGTWLSIEQIEEKLENMKEWSYELNFHPWYRDDFYLSSFQQEREDDIKKIKQIQWLLDKYNIKKITYNDI